VRKEEISHTENAGITEDRRSQERWRKTMKICMLMARPRSTQPPSVLAETSRLLTERGAFVSNLFPEEMVVNASQVGVDYDLYILKSKSELTFSLAAVLHAEGANILNPFPVARMIRNKAVAARVLKDAAVPVPDSYVAGNPKMLASLLNDGPLVVKPYMGSKGRGVQVVKDPKALDDIPTYGEMVFAQRYLKPDGRDHKIYVIGGDVFGVKRVWPAGTYEEKMGEPFSVTPDAREIALRCGRAFGVELYGLDIIWSGGKPYVVDISSFPGFKGVPDASRHIAGYIYTVARRVLNREPMLPPAVFPAVPAFDNRS
jgi:ribosomal protein S6--L-glutamate ligase